MSAKHSCSKLCTAGVRLIRRESRSLERSRPSNLTGWEDHPMKHSPTIIPRFGDSERFNFSAYIAASLRLEVALNGGD